MMAPVHRIEAGKACPEMGRAVLDMSKTLWTGGLILLGLCLAPFFTNLAAISLGLGLTYVLSLIHI